MQYWINHNGVQSGPVDLDTMKGMGLTPSAYVWHEGLADWVKITQLPELQGVYAIEGASVGQPMAVEEPQVKAETTVPPIPEQNVPLEGQSYQQQPYQQPYQPQYAGEQPVGEPCPPTNLVWAIISTVLCCLPAGIVAIVYALKVTNKYREGDIEGAKRASEVSAWWCIAAIVLGIICYPFITWLQTLALAG